MAEGEGAAEAGLARRLALLAGTRAEQRRDVAHRTFDRADDFPRRQLLRHHHERPPAAVAGLRLDLRHREPVDARRRVAGLFLRPVPREVAPDAAQLELTVLRDAAHVREVGRRRTVHPTGGCGPPGNGPLSRLGNLKLLGLRRRRRRFDSWRLVHGGSDGHAIRRRGRDRARHHGARRPARERPRCRRVHEIACAPADAQGQDHARRPCRPLPPLLLEGGPLGRPPAQLHQRRRQRVPRGQPREHGRGAVPQRGDLVTGRPTRCTLGQVALDLHAAQSRQRLIEVGVQLLFTNVRHDPLSAASAAAHGRQPVVSAPAPTSSRPRRPRVRFAPRSPGS